MKYFKTKLIIFGALTLCIGLFTAFNKVELKNYVQPVVDQRLGAYNTTGGKEYRLKSSASSIDTEINLSSFKEPVSDIPYTMSYLNTSIGYGTLEPQTIDKSEFVSFTGITQNSDGSAQLTGVTRGLTRTPAGNSCTASSTLAVRHAAQSKFIISDSPCHFAEYAIKRNDESISGSWSFPTPTAGSNPTTKTYVDSLVNGGTVSTDNISVAAVAGETVSAGQILFFNKYSKQWFKADADLASTSLRVMVGYSNGAGTAGNNINGGVMIKGLGDISSATPGDVIYISNTAGATSTSAGTFEVPVGIIKSATEIYFDPTFTSPVSGVSSGTLDDTFISTSTLPFVWLGDGLDGDVTIASNSTTTATRDMFYNNLTVNGALVTGNYRIFVQNTLSGSGRIVQDGNPGAAGSGTVGGTGAATTTGHFTNWCGAAGGGGGIGTVGYVGSSTPVTYFNATTSRSGAGGIGGQGGGVNAGGAAGTVSAVYGTSTPFGRISSELISGMVVATSTNGGYAQFPFTLLGVGAGGSGGGGGGGSGGNGGGGGQGGCSGGVVSVFAKTMSGTFGIFARGGAGGAGANAPTTNSGGGAGGGGGKGGIVIRGYRNSTWSGACTVTGGAGGAGGSPAGSGDTGATGSSGGDGICISVDLDTIVH